MTGLKSINFSTSSLCTADCVYCPSDRGECSKTKIMSFETFQKIIDEIASSEFKMNNDTEQIILGENGDFFLDPGWQLKLRYCREMLPNTKIVLFTNLCLLKGFEADFTLRFVNEIVCNLDSINYDAYWSTKKLDLTCAKNNLEKLVKLRNEDYPNVKISVFVLNGNKYSSLVKSMSGKDPAKGFKDCVDDPLQTLEYLEKLLLSTDDAKVLNSMMWAERDSWKEVVIPDCLNACPMLPRLEEEAFIAPDGVWYACCYDSKNKLRLGDTTNQTLQQIYNGEERNEFVQKLKDKKFKEIGSPCNTVQCCYTYEIQKKVQP